MAVSMADIVQDEYILPNAPFPDIADGALVQKVAHLLQLAPAGARIVKEVAELA